MNSILKPKSVIFIVLALYTVTLLFLLYLFYNDKKNDLNDYNNLNQKQMTRLYESNLQRINEFFKTHVMDKDLQLEKANTLKKLLQNDYESLKISNLGNPLSELIFKSIVFVIFSMGIVFLLLNRYLKKVFAFLDEQNKIIEDRAILFDSIADGVFGVNKAGNCIFINQVALHMLGFEEDEILNKNQHTIFHAYKPNGEVYPFEKCPVWLTIFDRQTRIAEDNFIKKDGTFYQ